MNFSSLMPMAPLLALLLATLPLRVIAAAPEAEMPTNSEDYGAWSLICAGQTPGRCLLSQVVAADPRGEQVVLGVTVHLDKPTATPRLDFRFSSHAVREAGVGLKVGDDSEYRLPMSDCSARACLASGWLEAPLLSQLEQAQGAQVAFMMPGGHQVLLPLSLQGFQIGLKALRQRLAAALEDGS